MDSRWKKHTQSSNTGALPERQRTRARRVGQDPEYHFRRLPPLTGLVIKVCFQGSINIFSIGLMIMHKDTPKIFDLHNKHCAHQLEWRSERYQRSLIIWLAQGIFRSIPFWSRVIVTNSSLKKPKCCQEFLQVPSREVPAWGPLGPLTFTWGYARHQYAFFCYYSGQ